MNVKLLKTLSETASVPGQEDNMRKFVRTKLKPIVDEISVDVMGNMVGLKKGTGAKKKKVMIAGHMDEIGFIVKHIDSKGFVRLQPLGGFDPRQLFAQRVIVHGKKELKGVLTYATKPTHLLRGEEAKAPPTLGKFYVDLGMSEKAVKRSVEIGDMVTMDRSLEECGDCVVGKSLDNRIGVYVMLEAVKKVKSHKVDIYAVATVQEEVGLRGAITSSFNIAPDIAIGLDVTIAADTPGSTEDSYVSQLGDGVALKIMDGSMISHPKLVGHLKKIAKDKKIPFQMEILPFGGTDGGGMQRSHGGAVSITISIPCRYVHTVNEMANKKDIDAAVDLLAAYLECAHLGKYDFA